MSMQPVNPELQAIRAAQKNADNEEIKHVQKRKQVERDIIDQEAGTTLISQVLAASTKQWLLPLLPKSTLTSQTPVQDSLKALKNLPPPPEEVQAFQKALQETRKLIQSTGLANLGVAAFFAESAELHGKETGIVQQTLNEGINESQMSLAKLEMIQTIANEVENLIIAWNNGEITIQTLEKDINIDQGHVASYSAILSEINAALKNGAIHYLSPQTFYNSMGMKMHRSVSRTFHGTIHSFLVDFPNLHNMQLNSGGLSPKALADLQAMMHASNQTAAEKIAYNDITQPINMWAGKIALANQQINSLQGQSCQRYIIPPGQTAEFSHLFPHSKFITSMNGHKEIVIPPGRGLSFMLACGAAGINLTPANVGKTYAGGGPNSIPNMKEAIMTKGAELCKLLGLPIGKLDFNDIEAALKIAKKLEKWLKKLLEALSRHGNGLAVFTTFMSAFMTSQRHTQQVEAACEQKSSDSTIQQLTKIQGLSAVITQELNDISNTVAQIQGYNNQMSQAQQAQTASMWLGVAALAALIVGAISNFVLPAAGSAASIAVVGWIASISGVAGGAGALISGLLGGGATTAEGVFGYEIGQASIQLGNQQKDLANTQAAIQTSQANATLTGAMSSATTQSLMSAIQREVEAEQTALSSYDAAFATVRQSAQI